MAGLTADRVTEYSLGDLLAIPVVGGVRIFAGSLVCTNPNGYAVPGADMEGLVFEGVATDGADNGKGSDGDLNVVVRRRGRYRLDAEDAIDQGDMSTRVYLRDDHTVSQFDGVFAAVFVGVIDRVEGSHDCWVSIDAAVLSRPDYRQAR